VKYSDTILHSSLYLLTTSNTKGYTLVVTVDDGLDDGKISASSIGDRFWCQSIVLVVHP